MSSTDISELCSQIQAIDIRSQGTRTFQTILVVPKIPSNVPCELFWSAIETMLERKPQTIRLEFVGAGRVSSSEVKPLVTHNVQIPVDKIPRYVQLFKSLEVSLDDIHLPQAHRAAITNKPELITSFAANTIDSTGRTPLHYAVHFEHVDVIQALVSRGAIPDFTTPHLTSPLYNAVVINKQELVAPLLQNSTISKVSTRFSDFQRNLIRNHEEESFDVPIDKITELATCLFATQLNRPQRDTLIRSNPLPRIVIEYLKEETIRRFAYHCWKIDWNFRTSSEQVIRQRIFYLSEDMQLTFTPVYGGFPSYFMHKMQKATSDFIKLYRPQQWLVTLCSSLNLAANQASTTSLELYERFCKNEPIILNVKIDSPCHAIVVMIWNYHFFICNKGIGSRKSVEVFRFQKANLTSGILNRIIQPFDSVRAYENYFFIQLFIHLQFKQLQVEQEFEELCKEPPQSVGNCAWESAETCVRTYFMFSALKEHGLLGIRSFKSDQAKSVCAIQVEVFNNWLFNQQIDCLSKYLQRVTAPNRKFASNYELLDTVIAQYKIKQKETWILPEIRAKMTALENTYPKYLKEE